MHSVNIITNDESLLSFLNIISTKDEKLNYYNFNDMNFFYENLTDYTYNFLKNKIILEIAGDEIENGTFLKDFYDSVPYFLKSEIRKSIMNEIIKMMNEQNMINFEPFVVFRLNKIYRIFKDDMEKCFSDFLKESKFNTEIQDLKNTMLESTERANSLVVKTYENKNIALFVDNELLQLENEQEQENIVIQSIIQAPKKVIVEDEFDVLSKETVIIMKQLFEDAIYFEKL